MKKLKQMIIESNEKETSKPKLYSSQINAKPKVYDFMEKNKKEHVNDIIVDKSILKDKNKEVIVSFLDRAKKDIKKRQEREIELGKLREENKTKLIKTEKQRYGSPTPTKLHSTPINMSSVGPKRELVQTETGIILNLKWKET